MSLSFSNEKETKNPERKMLPGAFDFF